VRRDKIADLHQAVERQLKPSTSCQSRFSGTHSITSS
jgi:hypothetical protein